MLERLRQFENLGQPEYFVELFKLFDDSTIWKLFHVEAYFYNRIISDKSIFDGCIQLLEFCDIVEVSDSQTLSLNYDFKKIGDNPNELIDEILNSFLDKLKSEREFHKIFSEQNIIQDLEDNKVYIKQAAFGFRYANIRRFLQSFGFFTQNSESSDTKELFVNNKWLQYFENILGQQVRSSIKTSLSELKEKLARQEEIGLIAEKYALDYENNRLNNKVGIRWVAPFNVSAGYDILSYDSESSQNRRFIEVKGYSGEEVHFFWSRNEIRKARLESENYYLYLININQVDSKSYEPHIIKNPSKNVLENEKEWQKSVESYFIKAVNS